MSAKATLFSILLSISFSILFISSSPYKSVLSIITVNGLIAKPGGELDWMTWDWSDDIKAYVTDLTNSMDTIILGRKLAEGFIPYWADVKANPDHPENEAGKIFTDTPKIVFSKTLTKSLWDNTTVVNGDLVSEIKNLKDKSGKDLPAGQAGIIAYGGAAFVSSLIKENIPSL